MDLKCLEREALAKAVNACKLTRVEICRQAGIDRVSLILYLNGSTSMGADNLKAVWMVLKDEVP